jgi:argininosuccinate synthase
MSRILIASKVAEVAVRESAEAVAHGCTGKGNDQYRMEVAFRYYTPDIRIVAPVRELDLTRSVEEELLRKQGIDPAKKVGKIGGDINMWSHSIGSGQMEDLSTQVESDYLWTVPMEKTPDIPTSISISYRNGVPTSVNGESDPVKMIVDLNETAGKNGIGKIDILEDGIMGFKSREIYEAPAATIFLKTHSDLEHLALTKEQLRLKYEIDRVWADMVYHGMWLHPLRKDLDAFIDSTQKYVNGTVTVKLYKGNVHITRRECDDSLFAPEIRSIKKSTFDQKEATGSVNMYTLQYRLFKSKKR